MGTFIQSSEQLSQAIAAQVASVSITDIHTHLFPQAFGELMSSGADDLINYHYLVAEALLDNRISKEYFWSLENSERADLIWQRLFVDQRPISEATRGIVTVLNRLGLATKDIKLSELREYFEETSKEQMIDTTLSLANVRDVVMTNDPLDEVESHLWINDKFRQLTSDKRFHRALRLDQILNDWENSKVKLVNRGYQVDGDLDTPNQRTLAVEELSRFLTEWITRMDPLYLAASVPSTFTYPASDLQTFLLDEVVMPVARRHNLTIAIMAGTKRQINPDLKLAGDSVASTDVGAVENLARNNPNNRFLVTLLSLEDQHRLTVVARKFSNIMIFGCWWFLNTPSLIEKITTMRLELLGPNFIAQHSDARVLEQLIYKWSHSRATITKALQSQYSLLFDENWAITEGDIEKDVTALFRGNFWNFIKRDPKS
ncbi:MAG: glucuronate isomerase [Actinomycetota bacterium]|nr:glucuronate isomerase [Actinomycetota bacterium]